VEKSKLKIVLTHGYFLEEDPKEKEIMKPYVPLGMLYVSAYLEENNFPNEVFDATFSQFNDLKNKLTTFQPDIIAVYTNLMTKLNVLKIIQLVKSELKLNTKIILGGPEVRHNAENFLRYGADLIVAGEGEDTMLAICAAFESTGILPENIEGTILIHNGEIRINPERALIRDINLLPEPARHKIDLNLYLNAWKDAHGYSQVSISTMRGCPYTCKWCSRAVYGGTYRRRKPSLVVNEIAAIKKNYNPDKFWFVDDVFTISHKWLTEFSDEIKKSGLKISYEIITRADRMNEEVIRLLKESGCFRIWIGAESGSQKIIDAMDRRVKAEQVRSMIKLTKKAGMEAGTFIMLGYPGEEKNDIRETIHHLIDADPDQYTITIAYPIKGTMLYNEVESKIVSGKKWNESTDREIEFTRNHPRKFYELGVRWIYNEVAAAKATSQTGKIKFKAKSLASQLLMNFSG
jgi:anaerobic magnesium-protoporphyrin IX monomethyl ester cyclase